MKAMGVVLLVASGIVYGLIEMRQLRNRVTMLVELQRLLTSLKARICYSAAPLEELLESENNPVAKAVMRESKVGADIKSAWQQASRKLFAVQSDRVIMEEFMEDFGRSDAFGQGDNIQIYLERISLLVAESRKEAELKGRVKLAASTFCAITIAIILM